MFFKFLRSWRERKEGTTAIEFALLAMPYLMLTLGVIEVCLMYASASLLEGATNSAARMVRTGEIQQSTEDPEEMFRDQLCRYATVLINCDEIVVEVQQMDNFSDFSDMEPQYDEDGMLDSRGFDAGASSDKVMIRTGAQYQMMTPLVGPLLSGENGWTLFMSTVVLQTEPYDFEGFDEG